MLLPYAAYEIFDAAFSCSFEELNFVKDSKNDSLPPFVSQGSSSVSIASSISSDELSYDSR